MGMRISRKWLYICRRNVSPGSARRFLRQQRSTSFRSLPSPAGAALPDGICLIRLFLFINIPPLMEASETTKLNQTHEANRCSSIKKKKRKKKSSLCIQMRKKGRKQSASWPWRYLAAGYNIFRLFFSSLTSAYLCQFRAGMKQICYRINQTASSVVLLLQLLFFFLTFCYI